MEIDPPPPIPAAGEPPHDCPLCPRLVDYRLANRTAQPDWWNAPVPGFGDPQAWLAVVGLAPGVRGANRTGRPFTGDAAGVLLYDTLTKFGLVRGSYAASADDGIALDGVFITNAVRCVPPGNKPTTTEIHACRPFLVDHLRALPALKVIVALGATAHQSTVKALGGKLPKTPFGHAAVHRLHTGYTVIDSYHCSQLNTNTGRLTPEMFEAVFALALQHR
jgi:uracil-DNA glycosylase family 4